MLKLWVVVKVFMLMRKKQKIDAIRLVRSTLIRGTPTSETLRDYHLAKDFVEDVEALVWPTHY